MSTGETIVSDDAEERALVYTQRATHYIDALQKGDNLTLGDVDELSHQVYIALFNRLHEETQTMGRDRAQAHYTRDLGHFRQIELDAIRMVAEHHAGKAQHAGRFSREGFVHRRLARDAKRRLKDMTERYTRTPVRK